VSFRWYALRRVGFALVALYLVVSVTFGFLALTPDPTVDEVARQAALEAQGLNASEREAAVQEAIREYREQRGLDDPIYVRYARWMVNVATFDWGDSYTFGVPVVAVLGGALVETLVYVVPAVLIVGFAPFLVLASYVVRLTVVSRRTADTFPFSSQLRNTVALREVFSDER